MAYFPNPYNKSFTHPFSLLTKHFTYAFLAPVKPSGNSQSSKPHLSSSHLHTTPCLALQGQIFLSLEEKPPMTTAPHDANTVGESSPKATRTKNFYIPAISAGSSPATYSENERVRFYRKPGEQLGGQGTTLVSWHTAKGSLA
jgi:hypothetical protein